MRKTFIILCIWSIIVDSSQEQKEEGHPFQRKRGMGISLGRRFQPRPSPLTETLLLWR